MSSDPPSPAPDGDPRDFERVDASDWVESDAPAATSHSAAEGVPQATEADMGRTSRLGTLKQMALSTEPRQRLEAVEDPWNPELGGVTRIYRGFQKAAGYDGLPAIADVTIGFLEWLWAFQLEPGRDRGGDEDHDRADAGEQGDPISAQVSEDDA